MYSKFLKHPRVSHDLMHATDWLPTLMAAIGSNDYKTSKKKLDGFNLWETFRKHEPSPRNEVLINIDPLVYNNAALKIGDWKLVNQSKNSIVVFDFFCVISSRIFYLISLRKSLKINK